jgi:uracil-DNA glycosylase
MEDYLALQERILSCRLCEQWLPLGPRPVFRFHPEARLLLVGQAPGTAVHKSGIPWDDPSGVRLRSWLGLAPAVFYDEKKLAIVPMGFCYPGKGKGGDLPPRPECALAWHQPILDMLPNISLILLVGRYAIEHYMPEAKERSLVEAIKETDVSAKVLPLVHPSPRNQLWLKKNPWFETEYVPLVRQRVANLV